MNTRLTAQRALPFAVKAMLCLLIIVTFSVVAFAQGTASSGLSGAVLDKNGAVIKGARKDDADQIRAKCTGGAAEQSVHGGPMAVFARAAKIDGTALVNY